MVESPSRCGGRGIVFVVKQASSLHVQAECLRHNGVGRGGRSRAQAPVRRLALGGLPKRPTGAEFAFASPPFCGYILCASLAE